MTFTQAASCGAAEMERPNGKRSAKGQSRDPKAEIRKAENAGGAGNTLPDESRYGRGHEAGWTKITIRRA